MNPITIPNITIPVIGIPSVGFPSASGGGLAWPAGLKESIKAIYDPAKQGMTNYDVIESYAEDFSKFPWNNKKEKYTGTLTPNTLTVTNVAVTSALIHTKSKPENFKVYITGIKDNQQVIFGDDTSLYRALIVEKDGVYDVNWEDNQNTYCIWCNFLGECDITIKQLPTSILQDLSGNGNHAYLYGGKGKLNSGMGVYHYDFTTFTIQLAEGNPYEESPNKIIIYNSSTYGSDLWLYAKPLLGEVTYPSFKVRFAGLPEEGAQCKQYYGEDYKQQKIITVYNGDNIIPEWTANVVTSDLGKVVPIEFYLKNIRNEITITQIPDYPDQLCYDGKMYAVCYDFPILTDYTVMADRTWFEKEEYSAFISNSLGGMEDPSNGAFSVELKSLNIFTTISFGSMTSIGIPEKGITYQTKQSYNGNSIKVGTKESNDILILGGRYFYKNNNTPGNTWTGCHGAIIVADHSFTEEEINWLKDNWEKI